MSKLGFTICVIISAIGHCYLVWGNNTLEKISKAEDKVKQVIKAADVQVVAVPQPKPQPAPQQEKPKETPKPEPQQPVKNEEVKQPEKKQPLPLEKSMAANPKTETKDKGSFIGDPDGEEMPLLRINWGTTQNAGNILAKSKMMLVVMDAEKNITKEIVALGGEKWQIRDFQMPQDVKYSQCIRNVSKVPAFMEIADAFKLKNNQYIAIMIPTQLEDHIEQVKNSAASSSGLPDDQIKAFGGQFNLIGDKVEFEITLITTRT